MYAPGSVGPATSQIKNIAPRFMPMVTLGAGISHSLRLLTSFLKHSKREVAIFPKRRLAPATDKISRQEIQKTEHLSFNSETQFNYIGIYSAI